MSRIRRDRDASMAGSEMAVMMAQAFLANTQYWLDHHTFPMDECLIRLHQQLVSRIHPFPNGNGRHARLMTDVIAVKFGQPEFTWGAGKISSRKAARTPRTSRRSACSTPMKMT